jgi:predicted O-methyltransferase YrrM
MSVLKQKVPPDSRRDIEKVRKQFPAKVIHILYHLVKHYHLHHIVEFGTSKGIYTAYMAKANPHASIFTVEVNPDMAKIASNLFQELNLTNIELANIDFHVAVAHYTNKFKNIDLFLINDKHAYDTVMRCFNYMKMYVKENTVFVLSEIHQSKEMKRAWKSIQIDRDVRITVDLYSIGIVFFRKGIVKQDFIL